jgi:hypothetical protein
MRPLNKVAAAPEMSPMIKRTSPKMSVMIPNGIAKHGFLNLAVAHPRREMIRMRIPRTMMKLPPDGNSGIVAPGILGVSTFPLAINPNTRVIRPMSPRRSEIPPTIFWHLSLVALVY